MITKEVRTDSNYGSGRAAGLGRARSPNVFMMHFELKIMPLVTDILMDLKKIYH